MNEALWKMVVDERGVTIANDRFQLTASGSPLDQAELSLDGGDTLLTGSSQLESALSELHTVTRGTYGQFCGLSRAMEMIGERWALLIVRDLFVGPKHISDLRRGLPRIPANILDARLRELERTGVIRRLSQAPESPVYELTEYGAQLEEAIALLSRWGARSLGQPRPEDIVTVDSMIMALRTTFHPELAHDLHASYELRLGEIVIHARVDGGDLRVAEGALPDADLVIEPRMALRALMAGEISPAEALENGTVRITGDPALFSRFAEVFTFRAMDAAVPA